MLPVCIVNDTATSEICSLTLVDVLSTLKLAEIPGQLVILTGAVVTTTFWFTVKLALLVTALPQVPLTTTLYVPASVEETLARLRLLPVWPARAETPLYH